MKIIYLLLLINFVKTRTIKNKEKNKINLKKKLIFFNKKWMGFGVEDIFIKRHHIVVNKYKIEILECFSKEERLLHVVFA